LQVVADQQNGGVVVLIQARQLATGRSRIRCFTATVSQAWWG
jgi:hypothetical protein